jgi:uncharacterized protein (TIGR03089 family)
VTFYDDATGERVELSVATFANWVAKTANLLQGDLAAGPGDRVALLLPAHWQTAVWVLACASVGVVADVGGDAAAADVVVSGPESLESARACRGERVALALRPLGGRFPQPPEGFVDYAVEVPGQGDRFAAFAAVDPGEVALVVDGREFSGAEVVERAVADAGELGLSGGGVRVLSGLSYDTWEGLSVGLFGPLASGGSVVLCRHLERLGEDAVAARVESERVSVVRR